MSASVEMLSQTFILSCLLGYALCSEFIPLEKKLSLGGDEKCLKHVSDKEYLQYLSDQFSGEDMLPFANYTLRGELQVTCDECITIKRQISVYRDLHSDRQTKEFLKSICPEKFKQDPIVCNGIIELFADRIFYVLDAMNPWAEDVCSFLVENCQEDRVKPWTVPLPSWKHTDKKKPNPKGNQFNILHLSDIHYDPLYTVGGKAICGEPLCCQTDQPVDESDKKCGYWLEYHNADPPLHTVEDALQHANSTQNFDYVYYTGDFVSHRIWDTSVAYNTLSLKTIFNSFRRIFKVPVYPVLGNHEANPLNAFAPMYLKDPKIEINWLFKVFYEEVKDWLPHHTKETILKGGYYTVSPRKGFRIMALNTNVCYRYNWWQIMFENDPYYQFAWMVKVLKNAEDNKESVHIISHVPPAEECSLQWKFMYRKIVQRFANVITGQFVGHTHRDQFNVYIDAKSNACVNDVVSVAFNGASLTSYTDANPSYKIFQVDQENFSLLDFKEWTYNLTLANINRKTDWYQLYSFREAFGVEDLTPPSIGKFLEKLVQSDVDLNLYNRYKYRDADTALIWNCDKTCHVNNLCEIVMTSYNDRRFCADLKRKYDEAHK